MNGNLSCDISAVLIFVIPSPSQANILVIPQNSNPFYYLGF